MGARPQGPHWLFQTAGLFAKSLPIVCPAFTRVWSNNQHQHYEAEGSDMFSRVALRSRQYYCKANAFDYIGNRFQNLGDNNRKN